MEAVSRGGSTDDASVSATELRESILALTRRLRRERPRHFLTPSQMQILGDVERGGPCAPVELAARQGVRVQSLTSNLNALEAAALITREQDRHDRRRQLVAITQTGRALVAADRTQRDHWLASAMAGRLNELERGILDLAGPVLRKLAEIPLDEVDSDAGDAVEQPAPRRS